MARVNRFIFNSDFMTVAHIAREEATVTIPAGETRGGQYTGEVSVNMNIPPQSWARAQVKYTGQYMNVHMACGGYFLITATKNNKQIYYYCNLMFEGGKLKIKYYVSNLTDTTTVLTDAQTVTLILDFYQQPNS